MRCARRAVAVSLIAGVVAAVWGPLAVQVSSADESAASYGFHGEYVDAERGLVDLGQRWFDPEHQVFYSVDPAPPDDPAALVGDAAGARGGRPVAIFSMCSDVGAIAGPLVAGLLVDVASFEVAFGTAAALLAVSAIVAIRLPRGIPVPQP